MTVELFEVLWPGVTGSMTTGKAAQPRVAVGGNAVLSAIIAAASGCALWLWAAHAAGKLEAWDGPLYFSRVVPALALVAGLCGFLAPRHPWRWPSIIYASQFVLMLARAEAPIGPLAPLGFIMMAVLAGLTTVPAYAGALARWAWNGRGVDA
jgi:hypothetical protein